MLYGDWIGRWGDSCPDAEALVDIQGNRRYRYREFRDDIYRMANFLSSELNIRKGDRVSVLSMSRAEYIVLFFAASRLGAILVPLNSRLTAQELLYYLEDSTPKALFCDATHRSAAARLGSQCRGIHCVCFDEIADDLANIHAGRPADIALAAEDPQMIIYTSGTTGIPKGVVMTHGMITWNSINTIIGWGLRRGDRTILHSALFYTAGWNVLTLPLFYALGTNILIERFDPGQVLDLAKRERVTVLFAVPTMFQMMMDSPGFKNADFSSLREVFSGGAPLPERTFEIYRKEKGISIRQGYGLTEAGPNNFMADGKLNTVGHPMPHVDIRLVDEVGNELTQGREGELLIKGSHLCAGYWNKPEVTAEAIKDGWLYTGDLARMDADGCVSIIGRKKDMFISGAINIYPAEIEPAITSHPQVAAAAVIGVPDEKWGEVGKAIVVPKPGGTLTLQDLQTFLNGRIAGFKIPKYLVVVDSLPQTAASSKVQKYILRELHGRADNS